MTIEETQHPLTFKDNEFKIATATTVEEAKKILNAGFDYVPEKSGIMLFRRLRGSASMYDKCRAMMASLCC